MTAEATPKQEENVAMRAKTIIELAQEAESADDAYEAVKSIIKSEASYWVRMHYSFHDRESILLTRATLHKLYQQVQALQECTKMASQTFDIAEAASKKDVDSDNAKLFVANVTETAKKLRVLTDAYDTIGNDHKIRWLLQQLMDGTFVTETPPT